MTTIQIPAGVDPKYYKGIKVHTATYLTPEEAALLDACMDFEGYNNKAGYIRMIILRNLEALRNQGLQA